VCYPTVKRLLDLTLALLGLVLLAPLLLVVALVVRLGLGRGIFFRQVRPGKGGRPFTLIKFRTMTEDRDATGKLLPDAQRLTAWGRFLRGTSLDELPELVNVVRGEMSLVGPRPLLMRYLDRYTPEQRRRHDVRPGITGLAQVHGRNALTWEERFALDAWYVDHLSFWLDCKVLLSTFRVVLSRRGIEFPNADTTNEYMGPARPNGAPPAPAGEAVDGRAAADVHALPRP
jgi:lipopolysaccharide/colanic/teichoic acid biosynthesis glycosyltransferase